MTTQEFFKSSIKWGELLCPDITIEKQGKIVYQEEQEFAQEEEGTIGYHLEAADCAWTRAFFSHLAMKEGRKLLAQIQNSDAKWYAKIAGEKALQAVSKSNWSKAIKNQPEHNLFHWLSHNAGLLQDVETKDGRQRYNDIRIVKQGDYAYITGTDHADQDNPIEGKILKPDTYTKAIDIYKRLLAEGLEH